VGFAGLVAAGEHVVDGRLHAHTLSGAEFADERHAGGGVLAGAARRVDEDGPGTAGGELQAEKLDQQLAAAADTGAQLGLTEDELATRLRRAIRNLDKK
jgi:hypothetical protein